MVERCEVSATDTESNVQLSFRGCADVAAARALHAKLVAILPRGRNVVLDVAALERLDGAGLQLLLAVKAVVEGDGMRCTVLPGEGPVRRAIEVAGAGDWLEQGTDDNQTRLPSAAKEE